MAYKLRPYQAALVPAVVADLQAEASRGPVEVVLAAAPNAGKTLMAVRALEALIASGTAKRVLWLSHATDLLRTQANDDFRKYRPMFTFAVYHPKGHRGHVPLEDIDAQVVIALPQSLQRLELEAAGFDTAVVDEAHLYYGKPMVTRIIQTTGAKRILTLTGTPAPFVARGVKLHSVSLLELHDAGFTSEPLIHLCASDYKITSRDYNNDGEVKAEGKEGVKYRPGQTKGTLDQLFKWFTVHRRRAKDWKGLLMLLSKTMLVCHNQKMATQVATYFRALDVDVALSTSDTDKDSAEIGRFKATRACHLLIVVNRATLGFDYDELNAVVDMTGTINIDRIFQMLCRVMRKPPDAKTPKYFVKLTSKDMDEYMHAVMAGVGCLSEKTCFESWNGKDLNGLMIPVREVDAIEQGEGGAPARKKRKLLPAIPSEFRLFEWLETLPARTGDGGMGVAWATLGRLRSIWATDGQRDPIGKKQELLEWYRAERRPLPADHPLYSAYISYCSKSSPMFDRTIRSAALEAGHRDANPGEKKREILEWYRTERRPVPKGHSLYFAAANYCTTRSPVFDPEILDAANRAGRKSGGIRLGSEHPRAVLNDGLVMRIRRLGTGGAGPTTISRELGVSVGNVRNVLRGRSWSHVK